MAKAQKQVRQDRAKQNQLRIIGGQWRSRRLTFPDAPGLRPTADRVRETLFNWLQADLPAAKCLDLYAGSGACGLEALSRGAGSVTFVEKSVPVCNALRANLALLGADNAQLVCSDVLQLLDRFAAQGEQQFDIVFIDPPYADGLLLPVCETLQQSGLLVPGAKIFLESGSEVAASALPAHWQLLKSGKAGAVYYYLCQNQLKSAG